MQPIHYLLLGIGVGALFGVVIGWLWGGRRSRTVPSHTQALEQELRQQLLQRDTDLSELREKSGQIQMALASSEAQRASAEQLLQEQKSAHDLNLASLKEVQEKALLDLREVFKGLSADALKQTHPEFLRLARETLGKFQETAKGDLSQRQESIKTLVEPLKQQLESYQKRLQQSETTQSTALGEVKKQLDLLSVQSQSLAQETQQFRMVLKSNQARGRWGEETLRRVVEAAGLSTHCDFTEQAQAGDSKPDLIVRLPGERVIIVDSKVPDLEFLQTLDTVDASRRAEALAAHATKLKGTIRALADREYPRKFPHALDHVVLFVPAESLFSAALEGDQDLIIWAASKKILLATPASFIALLRSVSISWQQHAQTENAQAIAESAAELFGRVCTFVNHFEKIRTGLDRTTDAFNDAVGSYERMVKPSGERLTKLRGADETQKKLPEITTLDTSLRLPTPPSSAASPEVPEIAES